MIKRTLGTLAILLLFTTQNHGRVRRTTSIAEPVETTGFDRVSRRSAGSAPPYGAGCQVGLTMPPDHAYEVSVVGNLAYVAAFTTLGIYDVSDPANPQLLGSLVLTRSARDIFIEDTLAFVAVRSGGLDIVNVADPASPSLVTNIAGMGSLFSVWVTDGFAYLADFHRRLWIVDVRDPENPETISRVTFNNRAYDVKVVDTLAYVATYGDGLQIFNVADPFAPVLVGIQDTPANARGVDIQDTLAYVCIGDGPNPGLQIVNIADPAQPVNLGLYNTTADCHDVKIDGTVAHLAADTDGYHAVDVSDPLNPTLIFRVPSEDQLFGLDHAGFNVYLADREFFQIVELSPAGACGNGVVGTCEECDDGNNSNGDGCDANCKSEPEIRGCEAAEISTPGWAGGVNVSGDFAYVADGNQGLQVFDIRNHAGPLWVGSYNSPGYARSVVISDTLAFIADDDRGLSIVRLGDPTSPTLVWKYYPNESVRDVDVTGTIAYVADGSDLVVLDVSDAAAPQVLSTTSVASTILSVTAADTLVYLGLGDAGFVTLNLVYLVLSLPLASFDPPGEVNDITVAGDFLFVAAGTAGLLAFDNADPTAPALINIFDTPGIATEVAVAGDYAFLADDLGDLLILNVSDPFGMDSVYHYAGSNRALGVDFDDSYVYLATGSSLEVVAISVMGSHWCGNGILEQGEECDDGEFVNGDSCSACCQVEPLLATCGNGIHEFGEECDDGNLIAGDGCDPVCQREPGECGNGTLEYNEECDDGNTTGGDGCSSNCEVESVCGNGIREPGEECDDGNADPFDGCDECSVAPVCGDGMVELPEECDDGDRTDGDGCDGTCQYEHTCGDGILEPGEECDDGNTVSDDGCSATCTEEICRVQLDGDVNASGAVTSADIIFLVGYVFKSAAGPTPCEAVGDVNCSGGVTSADIINLVNYVFLRSGLCDICAGSPLAEDCIF